MSSAQRISPEFSSTLCSFVTALQSAEASLRLTTSSCPHAFFLFLFLLFCLFSKVGREIYSLWALGKTAPAMFLLFSQAYSKHRVAKWSQNSHLKVFSLTS